MCEYALCDFGFGVKEGFLPEGVSFFWVFGGEDDVLNVCPVGGCGAHGAGF